MSLSFASFYVRYKFCNDLGSIIAVAASQIIRFYLITHQSVKGSGPKLSIPLCGILRIVLDLEQPDAYFLGGIIARRIPIYRHIHRIQFHQTLLHGRQERIHFAQTFDDDSFQWIRR